MGTVSLKDSNNATAPMDLDALKDADNEGNSSEGDGAKSGSVEDSEHVDDDDRFTVYATTTNNQQPTTNNQQPTTNNQQPTTNNNKASWPVCIPFVVNHISKTLTVGLLMAERDVGSARRRRERRLRSWLRHERMTVRMELAAALHHSSFRGAGPETHDAPRSQKTVNSREDAVFFELFDEDTAGWRPAPLPEVAGPQAQVLQRTVKPIVDAVPLVPLLDDPVPQTVEQLQDVLKFFAHS